MINVLLLKKKKIYLYVHVYIYTQYYKIHILNIQCEYIQYI